MWPLITVPDSSDGTQTHGHRSTETYRHPLILADRGCDTGPPGGAPKLHPSVWLVGDAVMKVGAVIPEADARWMRLICIAVSECWPMYQREAGVFIPYRGSSLPQFSSCLRETIHPHTCIRNGIIYLPPWALITQPQHPDGPQSCTRGPGCRKE